jgi:hypothetical protein
VELRKDDPAVLTGRSPEPGTEGPGHSLPRIPRGARNQETPMALTGPWSGEDDDTGYDYYDTPSGNIWRPGAGPGQPSGDEPGRPRHAAGDAVGAGTGPGGRQPPAQRRNP